jgi:protoporphyrinogen oxidase
MTNKVAIIIGAGPAGLTAAYELAKRSDIKPVIFEADSQVGGISKTVNYKGNRIDIGGHRFFSKSDRVMEWWMGILPLQATESGGQSEIDLTYHNRHHSVTAALEGADPENTDEVMLVRPRVSRILYDRKFFDYPIKFSLGTLSGLGLLRSIRIFLSYIKARLMPIRPERSLRDFIVNRFGHELYGTFFENYTEKVWGVPCEEIPAEWGAQRIKGLSITGLIKNAIRKLKSSSGVSCGKKSRIRCAKPAANCTSERASSRSIMKATGSHPSRFRTKPETGARSRATMFSRPCRCRN